VKVYVVFCHPTHESLIGAALERTLKGLGAAGHAVRLADLYAEGFRPEFDIGDREAHLVDHRREPERRPDISAYVDALTWCDVLVLVYPTWWSGQPAMLKGWFDRVLVRGVAWDLPDDSNRIRARLKNVRSVVAVTSHGSSKYVNMIEGETGKHFLTRSMRAVWGLRCRTRWLAMYTVDRSTPEQRQHFLDRVERHFSQL
jgi:NAD(P)H dehydrogenase (quinone)